MEFSINADELITKLETAKSNIEQHNFSDELYSALNSAQAVMEFRIFNKGLDAYGATLGHYVNGNKRGGDSANMNPLIKPLERRFIFDAMMTATMLTSPYMRKRIKAGRQVLYKDLEFTGSLRRSLAIEKDEKNKVFLVINSVDSLVIANAQEQQIANIRAGISPLQGKAEPAKIFAFGDEEKETFIREANALISKYVMSQFKEAGLTLQV